MHRINQEFPEEFNAVRNECYPLPTVSNTGFLYTPTQFDVESMQRQINELQKLNKKLKKRVKYLEYRIAGKVCRV